MTFKNIYDLDILRTWHFKIFVQKSKNIWQGYAVLNYLHLGYPCHIPGIWCHNFFQIGYPCHNPSVWQMCKWCEWVWVSRWVLQTLHTARQPAGPCQKANEKKKLACQRDSWAGACLRRSNWPPNCILPLQIAQVQFSTEFLDVSGMESKATSTNKRQLCLCVRVCVRNFPRPAITPQQQGRLQPLRRRAQR